MGASAIVKYHYPQCRFTYSVKLRRMLGMCFCLKVPLGVLINAEDTVRWGVWLGRHICETIAQVS